MAKPGTVIGWTLDAKERDELLERFPPRFEKTVAHHVTLATDAQDRPLPPPVRAAIVGRADDDQGVEAMVVAIDGGSARPDGSTFHITWSLDKSRGRQARESNDLLKDHGWTPIPVSVPVKLKPARF